MKKKFNEYIGGYCFNNCKSLEYISISPPDAKLSQGFFKGCESHEVVEGSFSVICSECFSGCKSLKKIYNELIITDIHSNAFKNCTSLPEMPKCEGLKKLRNFLFIIARRLRLLQFQLP